MDQESLAKALAWLTGRLRPAALSSEEDLRTARESLAVNLATAAVSFVPRPYNFPPELMEELRDVAAHALNAVANVGIDRLPFAVLTAADRDDRDSRVNGREVAETYGPFVDPSAVQHWCELYAPARFVSCRRESATAPFMLAEVSDEDMSQDGLVNEVPLGRSTIWLAPEFLGVASSGWVGLRIVSGSLRFTLPGIVAFPGAEVSGGELIVKGNAECHIQLTLDPQPGPPDASGDLATTTVRCPAELSIKTRMFLPPEVRIGEVGLDVYGAHLDVEQFSTAATTHGDIADQALLIPMRPAGTDVFAPSDVRTEVLSLTGVSSVTEAFWALPITEAVNPAELGVAANSGDLVVVLGEGLRLGWPGLTDTEYIADKAILRVSSSALRLDAVGEPRRQLERSITLGNTRSQLELRFHKPSPLLHVSDVRREMTRVRGYADGVVDPPVYADGTAMAFCADTEAIFLHTGEGLMLALLGEDDVALEQPRSLALANALLGVTQPRGFRLTGMMADDAIPAGRLELSTGLYWILPTLPDPYAANFWPWQYDSGGRGDIIRLFVEWQPDEAPTVGFDLGWLDSDAVQRRLPRGPAGHQPVGWPDRESPIMLLDVSTNADQFGVAATFQVRQEHQNPLLAVDTLHLCSPVSLLRVMTLPPVQWETVWNDPNPLTAPFPTKLPSTTSGGPALLWGDSVRLRPITPTWLSEEIVSAYRTGTGKFTAFFTLPFGIHATTSVDGSTDEVELDWVRPAFGDLLGARQFSITAGEGRGLPGASAQTNNGIDELGVTRNVLEPEIDDFYTHKFGPSAITPEVPVSRIDMTGYGLSCFSRWNNPDPAAVDVMKVYFDVLLGRTAHEVVQVRSILWPCQAVVVRSVTMTRAGGGRVIRRDSGWQAVTPGMFHHPQSHCVFHTGAVKGYHDIREIRDTSQRITVTDPVTHAVAELVAVFYDCDVALDNVVKGHHETVIADQPVRLARSKRQRGFVQVWPEGTVAPPPLTPGQLAELFARQGTLGGPLDCELDIGESGQRMRLNGVHADTAPPDTGATQFAVAVTGALRLPGAGQWSAIRVREATVPDKALPEAIDRDHGLPLVRQNGAGQPYRFADPRDLLTSVPEAEYGLLLATPAHRLLFREPRIEAGAQALTSTKAPQLADTYGLAAAGNGLFPRFSDAIPLPSSAYALDVAGEAQLRLRPNPLQFTYTGSRPLSGGPGQRLFVEYDNTAFRLTFDSTHLRETWTYTCENPKIVAEDGKLGRVVSALTIQEGRTATGLMAQDVELKFGNSLENVTRLITVLKKFGCKIKPAIYRIDDDVVIKLNVSTERDTKARPDSPPSFKARRPWHR
ncbi:hypothetical protein ACFQES_48245 [Nonomuraea salmonea]|uniref:hypothetical protein n=1 Tax=Nonomuraea salmonea TaxID=46181 RepID=UPI003605AB41